MIFRSSFIGQDHLPLCDCGRESSHSSGVGEVVTYRCCRCHVMIGGIPADWHAECMRAYLTISTKSTTIKPDVQEAVSGD